MCTEGGDKNCWERKVSIKHVKVDFRGKKRKRIRTYTYRHTFIHTHPRNTHAQLFFYLFFAHIHTFIHNEYKTIYSIHFILLAFFSFFYFSFCFLFFFFHSYSFSNERTTLLNRQFYLPFGENSSSTRYSTCI